VKYEIDAEPLLMYHCHCGACRAASGASYVTNVAVPTAGFRIASGTHQLGAYESSPGKKRYFCSSCGSPIFSQGESTKHYVSVRSGTLLDDPGLRPSYHAFVSFKAPWVAIDDGLPQYPLGRG
jgi:hypothetical protein